MWYKGKEEILKQLETSSKGITNSEANKRLKEEGLNRIPTGKRNTIWNIIIEQLKNPIIFILFFSAIFSIITQSNIYICCNRNKYNYRNISGMEFRKKC